MISCQKNETESRGMKSVYLPLLLAILHVRVHYLVYMYVLRHCIKWMISVADLGSPSSFVLAWDCHYHLQYSYILLTIRYWCLSNYALFLTQLYLWGLAGPKGPHGPHNKLIL